MRKFNEPVKDAAYLALRWSRSMFNPRIFGYFRDVLIYLKKPGAERIRFGDTYPIVNEKTTQTSFDSHYFYQDIWAARKIYKSRVENHVDIGSNIEFVGFLTTFTKVTFVDIRPLKAKLDNFKSLKGTILDLPFESNSVNSLSCLHVAEHIGLGRYGDPLDPLGTKKACKELSRVLARGGNLYFSLPVGKPRLCYNAHRTHSPKKILEYFEDLELVEFSGVDDNGRFLEKADIGIFEKENYACGLFVFKKK